jgi:DNA-binding MarR family transcriptional regulator
MEAEFSPDAAAAVGMTLAKLHTTRLPRRASMSPSAMSTLTTLERHGPHRITELAAVEGVAQSSMTCLVNGLRRAALVDRHTDPDDRRLSIIAITAFGLERLVAQRQLHAEDYDEMIALLPADEAASLARAESAIRHLVELAGVRRVALGSAVHPGDRRARNVIQFPPRHASPN